MNHLLSDESLWSPADNTVSRRHLRDGVRTVKLDDQQVRILPKYRPQRRRQLAVDCKPQLSNIQCTDNTMTALNGSLAQTAARRWKNAAKKTLNLVGGTSPAWSSGLVLAGHHGVDSSVETVISVSDAEDLEEEKDDGRTDLEFSDNDEDYDADVEEELNASSRLMLSRIIASKLRAALPSNAASEHPHIDEDHYEVHQRTRCEVVASCCRSFMSFLASTVGLTCLLVVYTLLGGVLFVELEAQHEQIVKTVVTTTRDDYVRQLWNITAQLNVLHPENWSALAEQLLERYADEVYVATKTQGWDGRQVDDDGGQQWSFAGGLLYSITVVTTIGASAVDLSMSAYKSASFYRAACNADEVL